MLWALGVAASYDAPLDRVLSSVGQHIFEEGHVTFPILLMHAAFALAEGGVLMYIAKQSHQEGAGAAELRLAIETMQKSDGKLDLGVALNRKHKIIRPFDLSLSGLVMGLV